MTDERKPLAFGISIDPDAADFARAVRIAQHADHAGLDYLAVQDHPYQPSHLEVWTLLTYLVARTEHIGIVPDVVDLQLRLPAMVAKAAVSLASMAGGRVTLGVGGGASADGVASVGGTPREGAAMVEYTEQAIQILRSAVRGGVIRSTTAQHQIGGYQAGPVPDEPIDVWLGSRMPRMLGVTGRASDGWVCPLNIYVPPGEVLQRQQVIDTAAEEAGRDPSEVRRIYNVIGLIGDYRTGPGLVGSVGEWVDTLSRWAVDLRFDTFIFWPATDPDAQIEVFTDEVVPAIREEGL